MNSILSNLFSFLARRAGLDRWRTDFEAQAIRQGKILAELFSRKSDIRDFSEVEFSVFSQWGDDGIIQWLLGQVDFPNRTFIEFGVEDYRQSNTRFLMMNNNWSGLVMDGSEENIDRIKTSEYFWKYELHAKSAFIETDNINELISSSGFDPEVGILHIDIDGNDYWAWKSIACIRPIVVIVEYNSVFGSERSLSIPYDKGFVRSKAHDSNLYWGASLKAFCDLAEEKGYDCIGSNSVGNNAYFVRKDKRPALLNAKTCSEAYVRSKFRESKSTDGTLSFLSGDSRVACIRGMPVVNTETGQEEKF